jgi:hypothetical protein
MPCQEFNLFSLVGQSVERGNGDVQFITDTGRFENNAIKRLFRQYASDICNHDE